MNFKTIVLVTVLCVLLLPACEKTTLNDSKPNNTETSIIKTTEKDDNISVEKVSLEDIHYGVFPQSSLYGYTLCDKAIEELGEDGYNLYLTKSTKFLQKEIEECYQKGYTYTSTLLQMKVNTEYEQEHIENTIQCYFPMKRSIGWEYTKENYSIDLVLVGQEKVFFSTAQYSYLSFGPGDCYLNSQICTLEKNTGKAIWENTVPYREILNLYEQDGLVYCIASAKKSWEAKSKVIMYAFSSETGEKKLEEEINVSALSNLKFFEQGIYFISSSEESDSLSLNKYDFNKRNLELLSSYPYISDAECTKVVQDDSSICFATVSNSQENDTINLFSYDVNQPKNSWQLEIPIHFANKLYSSFSLFHDEQSIYVTYGSACIAISKQTKDIQWKQIIQDQNIVNLRSANTSVVYLLLEPLYRESFQSTCEIETFYLQSVYNRVLVSLDKTTGTVTGKSSEAYISHIGYLSYIVEDYLLALNPDRSFLEVIPSYDVPSKER